MIMCLYHCMIVITLLNLMVSLLVKRADEVLDNEEAEFKYTRIVIYSEFIDWSSAVPPPFNLLFMAKEILLRVFDRKVIKSWPELWIARDLYHPDYATTANDCEVYNNLMLTLFSRFRASKECHYRTIFRTEFDKERASVESSAKVAFMNSYNDRYEAQKLDPMVYDKFEDVDITQRSTIRRNPGT